MAVEGGGSYLDRGSKGVQVLRAWALFRSGGGGLGMGRAQRTLVPLALSRSCLGLDPYLPWGSNGVRPQHQEPRSGALAYRCQHSSSDHPAPFLRATPPLPAARLGSLRMRGPLQPARFPNKSLSHQVPCAHAIPPVGGRGRGAFSPSRQIPLTVPHLRLRAPDRRRGHSHPVLRFQPIHHIPSVPPLLHNASQPCPPPCL